MLEFIEKKPDIKTKATNNAAKISLVAEKLLTNRDCARKYDM